MHTLSMTLFDQCQLLKSEHTCVASQLGTITGSVHAYTQLQSIGSQGYVSLGKMFVTSLASLILSSEESQASETSLELWRSYYSCSIILK